MATVRDIISLARARFGESEEATGADVTLLLLHLQSLYLSWVTEGVFGLRKDVTATADGPAEPGTRVLTSGYTITFPTTVTVNGRIQPPRDLSIITLATAGQEPDTRVYDAERGEWVQLQGLVIGGDAPLSGRNPLGLACLLALFISEMDGQPVTAGTDLLAQRFLGRLKTAAVAFRDDTGVESF